MHLQVSLTFVLPLEDWCRCIAPQVHIRVFLNTRPLICCWRHLAAFPRWLLVSSQLLILLLQLLDFVSHLHDDLGQATGALHGAVAALPEPRFPKNRRVVQEKLAWLLGI